jgi:hypothetical protein
MDTNKIKIFNKDGIRTMIEIDGNNMKNVKSFEVNQTAGEIPVLKLEIYADDVSIEGKAILDKLYIQ